MTPKPKRRRLTEAEWEAELARARGVQAADVERHVDRKMISRSGRRKSWWQRGWRRG